MNECAWCRSWIHRRRVDARFCSRKCRQAAWRLRRYASSLEQRRESAGTGPGGFPSSGPGRQLIFAYADPPYPGKARRYYHQEEVNHPALVQSLVDGYDGWALSTSAMALRDILPLCPPQVRVCAWVKPGGAPPRTYGLHNVWEPIIVLQGRRLRPGRRDALYRHPARLGGDLPGRKPLAFCAWLFAALGMLPGDELVDLFPGTGIVTAAWAETARGRVAQDLDDASRVAVGDAFPELEATTS